MPKTKVKPKKPDSEKFEKGFTVPLLPRQREYVIREALQFPGSPPPSRFARMALLEGVEALKRKYIRVDPPLPANG
jgi:ABC-type ATPase with predicted acetyltransferase domain